MSCSLDSVRFLIKRHHTESRSTDHLRSLLIYNFLMVNCIDGLMEFNDSLVFVHSFRSGPSMKLSSIEINQIVALMTFLRYFFMIFYIEVCNYR